MNGDGPSTRAILRVVGVLLAVALALWLIWVSRGVLTWVAIAAFLAVAINPLVNLLQDRLRLRRAPSILIVYILVAGLADGGRAAVRAAADRGGPGAHRRGAGATSTGSSSRTSSSASTRSTTCSTASRRRPPTALEGVAGPDTAVDLATRVVNGLVALISIGVICFLLSLYGRGACAPGRWAWPTPAAARTWSGSPTASTG